MITWKSPKIKRIKSDNSTKLVSLEDAIKNITFEDAQQMMYEYNEEQKKLIDERYLTYHKEIQNWIKRINNGQ